MLHQIALASSSIMNNGRTIGLLFLDNWHGLNLWCNTQELTTLGFATLVLLSELALEV